MFIFYCRDVANIRFNEITQLQRVIGIQSAFLSSGAIISHKSRRVAAKEKWKKFKIEIFGTTRTLIFNYRTRLGTQVYWQFYFFIFLSLLKHWWMESTHLAWVWWQICVRLSLEIGLLMLSLLTELFIKTLNSQQSYDGHRHKSRTQNFIHSFISFAKTFQWKFRVFIALRRSEAERNWSRSRFDV